MPQRNEPAHSRSRASSATTLGGKPPRPTLSPAATPNSRNAAAARARLSRTSSTSRPRRQSACACAIARRAARQRSAAVRSPVAHTIVVCRSAESIRPRASRPRSPTSATTVASASDPSRSMRSSVVFPKPALPKMPMRAPLAIGSRPSSARIPVQKGSGAAVRRPSAGAGISTENAGPANGGPASSAAPRPSRVLPSAQVPSGNRFPETSTQAGAPRETARSEECNAIRTPSESRARTVPVIALPSARATQTVSPTRAEGSATRT